MSVYETSPEAKAQLSAKTASARPVMSVDRSVAQRADTGTCRSPGRVRSMDGASVSTTWMSWTQRVSLSNRSTADQVRCSV